MRIRNQNKTSGSNTFIFRRWSTNLLVNVVQTTRQRIDYVYVNEAISIVNTERQLISSIWR